jgi:hypothetical protein
MAFQSSIGPTQGFGVPGELFTNRPWDGYSYTINSVSAAYNIIGATAVTQQAAEGYVAAGQGASTSSVFAGIIAMPKDYALYSGTFTPTLTVANQSLITAVVEGTMIVTLPAAAAIGDYVVYNTTTGALSTIAPGADLASGTAFAQAIVVNKIVSAAGLAVIQISPTYVIPQPA